MLRWWLSVFALAFGVRLVYVLAVPQEEPLILDQAAYNALAKDILRGEAYILEPGPGYASPVAPEFFWDPESATAVYPPGYPSFLAAVYAVFGENHTAARVLQALLWGLAAALLFLVAVQAGFSRIPAGLGAALLGIMPPHIRLSGLLLSENLFVPLLFLSVLLFILALKKPGWRAGLSGLALGAACLTRPEAVGLAALLLALLIALLKKRAWLPSAWLITGCSVFLVPWGVRNQNALGKFIIASTAGGRALYFTATGAPEGSERDSLPVYLRRKGVDPENLYHALNEAQLDEIYRDMAKEAFIRNPARALGVMALNPFRFAFNLPYPGKRPSARTLAYALGTLILMALAGYGLAHSRARHKGVLVSVFLYFLAFHTVMSPALVRYSLPSVPLLYPLAFTGAFYLLFRITKREPG